MSLGGSIVCSSDNLLYTSLTRYYNCVPFAGCVFVGPSKICHPRVKTFEEFPLEMHPQKAPQVSLFIFLSAVENVSRLVTFCKCHSTLGISSSDNYQKYPPQPDTGVAAWSTEGALIHVTSNCVSSQDNQTDSGMVLASEEFERIELKHRGAVSKRLITQKL